MSEQNNKEATNQKINPLNWILGFEYIVAIVLLVLVSLGYVLFK